ncbi:MAG: HAMP domain-containing histidine kinase [Gammaproteobacteria bacterium]|nr:HAMP domain-containing histidine kinase [Gammaproteobacteria bacterium]MBU1776048.1 HAMP domain-containing histidine kinase [Gammaproteobacteria bacterium]MBU1969194.1 HAMP domain-containing histidine kinase [Gammaproteobacteria bacterium]
MFQTNSLRFRVAFYYALFGAGLSIMLSGGVYLTVQRIGTHLIDETLQVEMDEHAGYLAFVSPNTKSIIGYALYRNEPEERIPVELRKLNPGRYDIKVRNHNYRVLVEDKNEARFYMLFDTESLHTREEQFFRYMIFFAIFMIVSSSIGGVLLASRVTASVTRLARQVGQAEPGDPNLDLVELTSNDEVGELARAFDRYLKRLREFIEREKYFTADVSHELRTPLAIMLGTVEVMEQDETLSMRQRTKLARIRRAAQDMIDLTSALLLMAREQQHFADENPCHVGEVLRSCVEKHLPLTAGRPIRLEVELIAEPDLTAEQPLLEIVIGNLIRNALFNTKSGSVLLRLEKDKLIVRDTGVGMRPEVLARALDHYYKGPSSAGSGVGLSLVKRICERYGWQIALESEEGKGTTATIGFAPSQSRSE